MSIEKYLGKGKVKKIIENLTLDRGYWGGHFLWKLNKRWGIDFVTLVRDDDLDFVKHVEYYLEGVEPSFEERWITVKRRGRKKKKKIRICGINGLYLRRYSRQGREKDLGKVNAVVIYDKDGKGRKRRKIYVTTLDAEGDPFKIYKFYKDRWTIENQGIRYLSQRWSLRDFAHDRLGIAFFLPLFLRSSIKRNSFQIIFLPLPVFYQKCLILVRFFPKNPKSAPTFNFFNFQSIINSGA